MKILVTGAAGFVGSHVLKRLKDLEPDVFGIDKFSSYYSVEYKDLRLEYLGLTKGSDVISCDISDFKQVSEMISGIRPDYIIHLAAQAGVRLSLKDSDSYISANVAGFQNITRSSIENKVKGIVYASSSSVYGDSTPTPYKEASISLRPKSLYGVTKLSNELFAEIRARSSNLRFRGLRYFTVYGPWGRPDMAYFRMIANVISGAEFNFFGDGSVERDFTFINDAVNSVMALSTELQKRKSGYSDVVNLGGGRPLSMNYLLQTVSSISKNEVKFNRLNSNTNDAKKTMSDSKYIESLIRSKPSTKLEDGIAKTIEWAKREDISSNLNNWVKSVQ